MFIALTLTTGQLTLRNIDAIEQICFTDSALGEGATIYLKTDPNSPIRLADTVLDIVKVLNTAHRIIKPLNKDDKSRIR